MAISYPPIFINDYLREKLGILLGPENVSVDVPFFPTSPSTIEQLTQTATINNTGNLFAVYDRMFKMRRKAFPHIKDEQLLYYFYSLDIPIMVDASQHIADLLDRGDESAYDLNEWIKSKLEGPEGDRKYIKRDSLGRVDKEFLPVYFHDVKIFQLEESRDIVDFGTARTFAGNKIIIDYCYHTKGYPSVRNEDGTYTGLGNTTYNNTTL
jgi:hypothetical protein